MKIQKNTPVALLHSRLVEIMGRKKMATFYTNQEFHLILGAVKNGWPFLLRRCPDSDFDAVIQYPPA